jgi:hypothetical protein
LPEVQSVTVWGAYTLYPHGYTFVYSIKPVFIDGVGILYITGIGHSPDMSKHAFLGNDPQLKAVNRAYAGRL